MNATADHPLICPTTVKGAFDAAIVPTLKSERVFVDNAEQARIGLGDHFPGFEGPFVGAPWRAARPV